MYRVGRRRDADFPPGAARCGRDLVPSPAGWGPASQSLTRWRSQASLCPVLRALQPQACWGTGAASPRLLLSLPLERTVGHPHLPFHAECLQVSGSLLLLHNCCHQALGGSCRLSPLTCTSAPRVPWVFGNGGRWEGSGGSSWGPGPPWGTGFCGWRSHIAPRLSSPSSPVSGRHGMEGRDGKAQHAGPASPACPLLSLLAVSTALRAAALHVCARCSPWWPKSFSL